MSTPYLDLSFMNLVFFLLSWSISWLKKYMGTNTDVAACLTPSTCDLFAASLLYVNVFNRLFVYVSTYDVFRASLASIGVAK